MCLRLTYPGAHFTGTRYTPPRRILSSRRNPSGEWERASPRAINSRNSCAGKIRRERAGGSGGKNFVGKFNHQLSRRGVACSIARFGTAREKRRDPPGGFIPFAESSAKDKGKIREISLWGEGGRGRGSPCAEWIGERGGGG